MNTIGQALNCIINDLNFDEITFDHVSKKDTSDDSKGKVNSRLHIFNNLNSPIKSGTVYIVNRNKFILKSILDAFKEKNTIENNTKTQLVLIDITPVCDYSQDKKYIRGVYALLIEAGKFKEIKGQKTQSFFRRSPILNVDNISQNFILDYRHTTSYTKSEFEKLKITPCFKLGSEITIEFQSEASKHIIRPGIISL